MLRRKGLLSWCGPGSCRPLGRTNSLARSRKAWLLLRCNRRSTRQGSPKRPCTAIISTRSSRKRVRKAKLLRKTGAPTSLKEWLWLIGLSLRRSQEVLICYLLPVWAHIGHCLTEDLQTKRASLGHLCRHQCSHNCSQLNEWIPIL